MHQLVKLTDVMTFTAGNSPLIHALGDPSQALTGSPDWEADDLPNELSLPPLL